jgi:hypothetical protein
LKPSVAMPDGSIQKASHPSALVIRELGVAFGTVYPRLLVLGLALDDHVSLFD